MINLGPVPASTTIYVPFSTYGGSTGASITCSGLAVTDVEIYKNGSTTQRSSDAGIALLDTDGIDFDGITGLHGFSVDLSDNTDSGFYAVGSWYWVVVSAITVDSQTVTFLAATFRIAPAESLTGHPKTDVGGWLGNAPATPTVNGVPEVDITHLLGTAWLTPGTAGTPDVNLTTTALGSIWNRLTASMSVAGSIGKHLVDYLTGDIFALIGATGSGLTSLAQSSIWTNTLATNLATTNSTVATNLDVAISVIQAQIAALNNLSAKANWFGSALLEVPDSGTRAYIYELVVRDDEDKIVNLDGSPTIALTNAAGTDRSSLITTTVANPSTGRYTITITVGTATDNESLKLTATGAISGEARYAVMGLQVVDYDNATQVALILTRLGTPVVSVSADIAAAQTDLDTLTAGVNVTQVDGSNLGSHGIGQFPADVRDWGGLGAAIAIDIDNSAPSVAVSHIHEDAISAAAVSAAAAAKLADISRRRTQANVEASSDGDALSIGSLYGLIQQAQESNAVDAAGYLTIYKTDGSTSLGTKVLSTNAAADPVDGIS